MSSLQHSRSTSTALQGQRAYIETVGLDTGPPKYDFGCLIPKLVKNNIFVPILNKKGAKTAKIGFFWGHSCSFRDSNIIKHIWGAS